MHKVPEKTPKQLSDKKNLAVSMKAFRKWHPYPIQRIYSNKLESDFFKNSGPLKLNKTQTLITHKKRKFNTIEERQSKSPSKIRTSVPGKVMAQLEKPPFMPVGTSFSLLPERTTQAYAPSQLSQNLLSQKQLENI
jgi:hypothetical protein